MAQPTDESKTTSLPEPELNPLLNPLLAAHMGRWAEVYFTSPPEKRAQAVADLVRELAKNSASEPAFAPTRDNGNNEGQRGEVDESPIRGSLARASESFENVEQSPGVCESCGHKNTTQQRFCGMCGTPRAASLDTPAQQFPVQQVRVQQVEEAPRNGGGIWNESNTPVDSAPDRGTESNAGSLPVIDDHDVDYHHESQSLGWASPQDSPPEFSVLSDYESEPSSPSYRIYVGVVVTILLGLLVYMTWRSNAAFWSGGTARSLPAAVETPKSESAAEAGPPAKAPAPPSSNTRATQSPTPQVSASQNQNRGEARRKDAIDRRATDRRAKVRPTPRAVSVAASPKTSAGETGGSEELATAEKLLHTGPGTARDTREAATWLWKAVAKQNSTATLLLSDLYLRGDGVPKSCDQARLLLVAAARKGATAAAERLRNLQAFGCR